MPEDTKQVNDPNLIDIDKILKGALGDKPFEIKGAFDNEMLDRVSQVIAGKKDAVHKGMFGDQELGAELKPNDDEVLDQELTDDEIEDALNDEAPEEEQEEETPEEEPEVEPEEVENEEPNETT
jgi:hypothetical protein